MNSRRSAPVPGMCSALLLLAMSGALPAREALVDHIDERFDAHRDVALRIWDLAELGYQEFESSALLQERLGAAGFAVESGVAGMPTAFVAEAGGPAAGTGTTVEWEIMHGSHSLLPNPVIAERMQANLEALGGTTIGIKGLQLAAKALALTAADFFEWPDLLRQARLAFDETRGEDFVYAPLIGEREPPLDYRRTP